MQKILFWANSHKLVVVLSAVILILLAKPFEMFSTVGVRQNMYNTGYDMALPVAGGGVSEMGAVSSKMATAPMPFAQGVKVTSSTDRMIVTDTWLSLVTKNVKETLNNIEKTTKDMGGFMIDSSLSTPEGAASGNISIRVPKDKLKEVLETIHGFGLRVVDEHVTGQDITDQYSDLEAQLDILQKTKSKFETILSQATTVADMLNVQRELISLQSQIDSIKGQQQYMKSNADFSRITVYLSTDDFSLPYAPEQSWRPQVTFKLAVRGLVGTMRSIADKAIWIVVYAPIWIPFLLIVLFWYKKRSK